MQKALKIWILIMPVVMLLFTACINDDFPEDDATDTTVNGEEPTGDLFIRFSLRLGDGMISRAEGGISETVGSDNEKVINTVDILVFDAADNTLFDMVCLDAAQVNDAKSGKEVTVPIMGGKGKTLHIYAAVNMPPQMRSKFIYGCGTDVSYRSAGVDFWNVMDEFVPGSNGNQEKLGSSGIPMTGQFKVDGDNFDITVTGGGHSTKENALDVSADLSRIVAKVHVLAKSIKAGTPEVDYVIAAEKSAAQSAGDATQETFNFEDWLGWMRLSDVRYIINGTNKSTYLLPQKNAEGKMKDLNMNLAAYRSGYSFDESLWGKDFNYYHGISLHSANISNNAYFGRAGKFDEDSLSNTGTGTGAANRYTKGLYCLENYFDIPTNLEFYSRRKNTIPMVTHLSIATKLVPRDLVVLQDFPEKLDLFFEKAKERKKGGSFYEEYGITEEELIAAGINLDEDAKRWEGTEDVEGMKQFYFVDTPGRSKAAQPKRKEFYIFSSRNIEEANCFINWSLIARGLWSSDDKVFTESKYPKNTYYVYDTQYDEVSSVAGEDDWGRKYVYLVAGAVANATDDNIGIKLHSVPHVGGWGYYYTYIDNDKMGVNDVPFTSSQVTRNTYYIITVDNFGTPGGTITDPEYIKVNTERVGWDYFGRGDIILH